MKRIIAFFALTFSTPASSQTLDDPWTYIETNKNGTAIYARSRDILVGRSHHTSARVWIRMDSSRDPTIQWREAVVLYAVNCPAESYAMVQMTVQFPNGRSHTFQGDRETNFTVPDSPMEKIMDQLCVDPAENPDYR